MILEREAGVAKHGGPAGARIHRWVVELMLASGLRISEVCALRNMDVDLQAGTIAITGTMIEDEHYILIRQDELKARDQARIIKLPRYGCNVLHEARSAQETIPSRLPQSPALHGRRGNTLDPRKIRIPLKAYKITGVEKSEVPSGATGGSYFTVSVDATFSDGSYQSQTVVRVDSAGVACLFKP